MRGITEIYWVETIDGETPAKTNRRTGEVWLDKTLFGRLPYHLRLFVLFHELGHIVLNTVDEFEADSFAFKMYAYRGYPLSEAVYALSRVLTFTTDEHFERAEAQLKRALHFDCKVNGHCHTN